MNTSDVLDLAADEIERRGWAQGYKSWFVDRDAGLCIEGGIAAAAGVDMAAIRLSGRGYEALITCPAYRAVVSYLERPELWRWNDAPDRTASEVIATLRAAAAVERAREAAEERVEVSA